MKYKIHVTTSDGELLDSFNINTDEKYWDSGATKSMLISDIFEEIYKDYRNREFENLRG